MTFTSCRNASGKGSTLRLVVLEHSSSASARAPSASGHGVSLGHEPAEGRARDGEPTSGWGFSRSGTLYTFMLIALPLPLVPCLLPRHLSGLLLYCFLVRARSADGFNDGFF